MVLCGAESFTSKTAQENHELVVKHVKRLESIECIGEQVVKIFIIESNLGLESQHLELMIKSKLSNFVVLRQTDDRVGFLTTNEVKTIAVERFRETISSEAFMISNQQNFACISRSYEPTIEFLVTQLLNFTESVVVSAKIGGKTKKIYNGKSVGSKDDLVMAILIGFVWIPIFYSSDRYEMIRR